MDDGQDRVAFLRELGNGVDRRPTGINRNRKAQKGTTGQQEQTQSPLLLIYIFIRELSLSNAMASKVANYSRLNMIINQSIAQ